MVNTPYRYNGKAYKRNDSSTIEVDAIEEKRLILAGMNISFEELNANEANLKFSYLCQKLKEIIDLENFNLDTFKSLNLYNSKFGYNNAAKLLSDENDFPVVDIAIFGNSINIKRIVILLQYRFSCKSNSFFKYIYKGEYIVEKIDGGFRKKVELIPFEAYREALANAIVHRTWDINANTKIEMYQDKIIISSPGGLDGDMTKEDYIKGNYSYLRNPIIANVFRRLNIIEAFATGIKRINEAYKNAYVKPTYNVTPSAISITLPVIEDYRLSLNEAKVIDSIKDNYLYSRSDIEKISGFTKDKLIRLLASLQEKGLIEKSGKGRTTYYKKK